MAFGTVFDNVAETVQQKDKFGRTALMATAMTGSIDKAKDLLNTHHELAHFGHVTPYGESAIFFALR